MLDDMEVDDNLWNVANENWIHGVKPFNSTLIDSLYKSFHSTEVVRLLEVSHYLEQYLWHHVNDSTEFTHSFVMSIVFMVNQKFKLGQSNVWSSCSQDKFSSLFNTLLDLKMKDKSVQLSIQERMEVVLFIINCFQSLEVDFVRNECLRLVSLPLWGNLNERRLELELRKQPAIAQQWRRYTKKASRGKMSPYPKTFIPHLFSEFLDVLNSITDQSEQNISEQTLYIERFFELVIDLLSQIPTRKHFLPVFEDSHIIAHYQLSEFNRRSEATRCNQLFELLKYYMSFEIDEQTGVEMSEKDMIALHNNKILSLQRICFKYFPKLRQFSLTTASQIESKEELEKHFSKLDDIELRDLCEKLSLVGPATESSTESRRFLLSILITYFERLPSLAERIKKSSLLPTEQSIWNESVIPSQNYMNQHPLAIPKLNLQFLTFPDYFLRNFTLYQSEQFFQVKNSIEDIIKKMNGRINPMNHDTQFQGTSNSAVPIDEIEITKLHSVKLGDEHPSRVEASIKFNLEKLPESVQEEWRKVTKGDLLYLVAIQTPLKQNDTPNMSQSFAKRYGVKYVRGCEVITQQDVTGTDMLFETDDFQYEISGENCRKFIVELDAVQYAKDHSIGSKEGIYKHFNLLIRADPTKSGFKTVLETVRDLMDTRTRMPQWLKDSFLGYGDDASLTDVSEVNAHYLFKDAQHLTHSLSDYQITFTESDESKRQPPFKLQFSETDEERSVIVQPYVPGYRERLLSRVNINLNVKQVEAIISSLRKGLTLVSGPSGSGKKETTAHIISTLYMNAPKERTLVVSRSNRTLNAILEKIVDVGVDQSHVLRLGYNDEKSLKYDLSESGRINFLLQVRLDLLKEAEKLAASLMFPNFVDMSCADAANLYNSQIIPLWNAFYENALSSNDNAFVQKNFPFNAYFTTVTFEGLRENDIRLATECYQYLQTVFETLADCRALEVIRAQEDRAAFILKSHARVIGVTSTQASIRRRELIEMDFQYDNVIIDEAHQLLEVESFIPMLLQANSNLKRVVLIGDQNQSPPVVENRALRIYSHLNQSLFSRFIRLRAAEPIYLNTQYQIRPSIAKLLSFQYPNVVSAISEDRQPNPGFKFEYQLINVPDYLGKGQVEPSPMYYQNLAEAEYIVALYMYMRLVGYPRHSILILATSQAQVLLINDVLTHRCKNVPLFGLPFKVCTIDDSQAYSSDYVLVSFVRTNLEGETSEIRDIRRLITAVSRSRLGFYLLGRQSILQQLTELEPIYSQLIANGRPTQLHLTTDELYQQATTTTRNVTVIESLEQLGKLVYNMTVAKIDQLRKELLHSA